MRKHANEKGLLYIGQIVETGSSSPLRHTMTGRNTKITVPGRLYAEWHIAQRDLCCQIVSIWNCQPFAYNVALA
jgi:hypothetical protein